MKTYSKTIEKTLITFHTGRGGRFYNPGHVSFVNQDMTISSYTDDLFLAYENASEIANKIGDRENLIKLFELAKEVDGVDASNARERFEKITGLSFGELVYVDWNGSEVGLAYENDGTGRINIDNAYNTTVVKYLEDCSDDELLMIYKSNNWKSADVQEYCKNALLEANLIFEDDKNEDESI